MLGEKGRLRSKIVKKRSFYLSAARSEIFNLVVAERIEQNVADRVLRDDIVQLNGSHSWFKADENEDLAVLQQRLKRARYFIDRTFNWRGKFICKCG